MHLRWLALFAIGCGSAPPPAPQTPAPAPAAAAATTAVVVERRQPVDLLAVADAIGEAHAGLDALASLASRRTTKKIIAAQIAAIRALGKMAEHDKAAGVL